MSTIEYKTCDYLGCVASVSVDDDAYLNEWGSATVTANNADGDELRVSDDLCPEHLEAIRNMLEGRS